MCIVEVASLQQGFANKAPGALLVYVASSAADEHTQVPYAGSSEMITQSQFPSVCLA